MSESERTRSTELRAAPSAKYRNRNASGIKVKNALRRVQMSETMNQALQIVYLPRPGETPWPLPGQYTGLTDLALTERGERSARRLEERLRGLSFSKCLPAHCSVSDALVSWPALELSLKSTGI